MTKGFDPSLDVLTVNGIKVVYDEFDVDFDEDRNMWSVGTSGEPTATKNANKLATLNITVPMTAAANDILSVLYQTDATFVVGFASSASSLTKFAMPQAKINRMAPMGRAKESGQNSFVIKGNLEALFHSEYDSI